MAQWELLAQQPHIIAATVIFATYQITSASFTQIESMLFLVRLPITNVGPRLSIRCPDYFCLFTVIPLSRISCLLARNNGESVAAVLITF